MNEPAFAKDTVNHDIGLLDKQTYRVFNDKLTFKYVEITRFNKDINQLESNFDKWLYVLRNLSRLDHHPKRLQNAVFDRLFEEAKIGKFSKSELREYENSLKAYRDLKNSLDTAEEKGRAEGRTEERVKNVRNLLAFGLSVKQIAEAMHLTVEEINGLLSS